MDTNSSPTPKMIDQLLQFLPVFSVPGRTFSRQRASNEQSIPWTEYHEDVEHFLRLLSHKAWQVPNYQQYDPHDLLSGLRDIKRADLDDIRAAFTFCHRAERFNIGGGYWESVFENGKVVELLQRLKELRAEMEELESL